MALVVETGSGNLASESYVSVAACKTYCDLQGLTFDTTLISAAESALRRATQFIDYNYRMRFPGTRLRRRAQALEWPRVGAYYYNSDTSSLPYFIGSNTGPYVGAVWPYDIIDSMTIPIEVVNATCQAAVFENANPGVLLTGISVAVTDSQQLTATTVPITTTPVDARITKIKAGDTEISYDYGTTNTSFAKSSVEKSKMEISAVRAGKIMIDATLAPLIMVQQYTLQAERR